jgi:hypothetical protein
MQLPKEQKVVEEMEQLSSGTRSYVINAKLKGGKAYDKTIGLSTLEDFVADLPADEKERAYPLPHAKAKVGTCGMLDACKLLPIYSASHA